MDFLEINQRIIPKTGTIEVYPDFLIQRCSDIMIRGGDFYAVWDKEKNLWSTDEYDVARLVDQEMYEYRDKLTKNSPVSVNVCTMRLYKNKSWTDFRMFVKNLPDHYQQLDTRLTFKNTEITKDDYVSKRLPYSLEEGPIDAYNELMNVLYAPEERDKIEWAIGSIIDGASRDIQKFIVLYGDAGTGKSTVLNIIQNLFEGYYVAFDAKSLGNRNNSFATESFRSNPLVAIQHDGDLSRIEDNTVLNSIVSHEELTINEKFKATYTSKFDSFLFMGTNQPVKITDAKSGIIRRLIDVNPTGDKIPPKRYQELISKINFELGSIANYCLKKFRSMGKNYYSSYVPKDMIMKTDLFYNFVEDSYNVFSDQDETTLDQAWEMYVQYCTNANITTYLKKPHFREELKNYFDEYYERKYIEGERRRNWYVGFMKSKFDTIETLNKPEEEHPCSLVLDCTESLLDKFLADYPAQYGNQNETPSSKWEKVTTTLKDLDTSQIHYVKVPEHHIVIDFDIKDENGEKSQEKNIEAASKWPSTYAEYSKSGKGVHLHYNYTGDVNELSRIFDENIEIKVFTGNSSLRRRLTFCNNIPVADISSGLPVKGEKMINFVALKNEKAIRTLIKKNLNKECHPATKPSVDFIKKILDDAYESGMHYDVSDMQSAIVQFAANSSNQSAYCLSIVNDMHFKSEEASSDAANYLTDEIVFYDVEVFPNLFVVVWKVEGPDHEAVTMINPSAKEIENLIKMKLVGFNCRGYDNHILYARLIGYNNQKLFELSQKIVNGEPNCHFAEAYGISYTDIYEFSSVKQSLKKFEIELGIHHLELGYKWDEPVPEDKWQMVADYCINDVVATEAVFHARHEDFVARQIIADLSGLSVNDSTRKHIAKFLFGNNKHPQSEFVYTDLSTIFPGYEFKKGKSSYLGEDPSEGGRVYAKPGIYGNVALLDVTSLHPTSAVQLNIFGKYTKKYAELIECRKAIKHKDYDKAKSLLGGVLAKYLTGHDSAKALSYALKIIINSVYGYTSSDKYDWEFRDPRNVDNIVAKRGSLFMILLQKEVEKRGFTVVHIKTDSIKIADATPEIIQFCMDFANKYGYNFEHEATYEKICLVNDAVYIAQDASDMSWTATGTQFQVPYVFKTLFSKEPIGFDDLCETKTVKTAMYLDMNEKLDPLDEVVRAKKTLEAEQRVRTSDNPNRHTNHSKSLGYDRMTDEELLVELDKLNKELAKAHNYQFIGKAGQFCPIKPGCDGGLLVSERNGTYNSVVGTKGYRWLESEYVRTHNLQDDIDMGYYINLADTAIDAVKKYGDFDWFASDEHYSKENSAKFINNPYPFITSINVDDVDEKSILG